MLENPVPCGRGVTVKGALGLLPVSDDVRKRFEGAREEMKEAD